MISLRAFKTVYTLTCALLIVSCFGCHSSKSGYKGGDVTSLITDQDNASILYSELVNSYKPWNDLYVPIQMAIESPKRLSISGRATMTYGKDINISLRMLGMEVGYVYINDKDIWVVDKFHKYYFNESISELLKEYNLSLTDLQDLLLGRAVVPGKGLIGLNNEGDFSFLTSDDSWILSPKSKIKGVDWNYTASRTDPPLLSALSLRTNATGVMQWSFDQATTTPAGIVDGLSTITVPYKDQDIIVSISWMLNDAKWDSGREVNFSAPNSSYKKLSIEDLLKALENK